MDAEKRKRELLRELQELIASRGGRAGKAVPLLSALAEMFFRGFPAEDLQGFDAANLYGFIGGALRAVEGWDQKAPVISIFNPESAAHGWESRRTAVVIVCRDMPFLLESARGELNRRNINIHALHSQHFALERGRGGRLEAIRPAGEEGDAACLMYFSIDRQSAETGAATVADAKPVRHSRASGNPETESSGATAAASRAARHSRGSSLQAQGNPETKTDGTVAADLRQALEDILGEVALVVDDFAAMQERLREAKAAVEAEARVAEGERKEHLAFLEWLERDHITLLGYECLEVRYRDGEAAAQAPKAKRLGLLRQRRTSGPADLATALPTSQITFAKSRIRSRVHRFAYPDYIEVNQFDAAGRVARQHRFLGLYTFSVYFMNPRLIPIVRLKVREVLEQSGAGTRTHQGRGLARLLSIFPRDELFHSTAEELREMALAVNRMQERRQVRLFARLDARGKFINCMVYMPRDRYTTARRVQIQELLREATGAEESEFTTFYSESVLVRIHFVLLLGPRQRIEGGARALAAELQGAIERIASTWEDGLRDSLIRAYGEERGIALYGRFKAAFPAGYREAVAPEDAVADLARLLALLAGRRLELIFRRTADGLRLRLFHRRSPLPLSNVLPILEDIGLQIHSDASHAIRDAEGEVFWMQDFGLKHSIGESLELESVAGEFCDAFEQIWFGRAESDGFNQLLLRTRMNWREIAVLRAYARYLKQIKFGFSTEYIAETLAEHLPVAEALMELFHARFDPALAGDAEGERGDGHHRHSRGSYLQAQGNPASASNGSGADERAAAAEARILDELEAVENLAQDRIIRQYLALIRATVRVNFYRADDEGEPPDYFSFKLQPADIPGLPPPAPRYEIFVYSPRVEGAHLRGGKVARGGVRWSDRSEDFRTEVLGLVKAQQVKNAVIVPVGAKGGFVPRRLPPDAGREEALREGIACYRIFIQGLLDLSDDIRDGQTIPPPAVARLDDDDPYLVVAADKGTAAFSDIANELAEERGFWLGDAFASGGSAGYDHKKMGITARGAWVSVRRHFREMGMDTQTAEFTVVGIGDMGGDVFGNGMLLSPCIRLTAAFNHRHIFIDPDPDAAVSFKERERLFRQERAGWEHYDAALISPGGGVFSRAAKAIPVTSEMRARFGIEAAALTPAELISALLRAPVDLLWNGGIGTYIKAAEESHAEVGDKANDAVRVNGAELRCKVVGEGGNLGMTQLGRVEYCRNGGRCNTDFIDNAAGVDCSDHEVNIKILLNARMARGALSRKQRDKLLAAMTDSVAELVLRNNYAQTGAISLAESEAPRRLVEHQRLIARLEQAGALDRELEFIPDDAALRQRRADGEGLTRPELAVLVSCCKNALKEELARADLAQDPCLAQAAEDAFPPRLLASYSDEIRAHPLRREIAATRIAGDLIDAVGIGFVSRLEFSTGSRPAEIAAAYITVRDILGIKEQWQAVAALDYQVPHGLQMEMLADMVRLARRGCHWLLRSRRHQLDPARAIAEFQAGVAAMEAALPELLAGAALAAARARRAQLMEAGVPEPLARFIAGSRHLYLALSIIEAAAGIEAEPMELAALFFRLGDRLKLDWLAALIAGIKVENEWEAQARESFLEDLEWQQRAIATGVLRHLKGEGADAAAGLYRWMLRERRLLARWRALLAELREAPTPDFAMFAVINRELLHLAQSAQRIGG